MLDLPSGHGRNAELGVMIGHRPPGPPGVEEGLRSGIARAVYEASIGGPATDDSRLMEEADDAGVWGGMLRRRQPRPGRLSPFGG